MWSLLHEHGGNSISVDAPLEDVKQYRALLSSPNEGLKFNSLTFCIAGYGEITNRRTTQLQRQQGHVPKRCFVFPCHLMNGAWTNCPTASIGD